MLFFGLLMWVIVSHFLDLAKDEKVIIKGYVTDKRTSFSRLNSTAKRYISIDGKRIPVNIAQLASVKSGDFVEVHYGKYSKLAFSTYVLYSGAAGTETLRMTPRGMSSTSIHEQASDALHREDRKILVSLYRRSIRFEMLAIAFVSYLMLGLILNQFYVVIIFLFPLPLTLIWLSYRLIRKTRLHYADINSGEVSILETVLLDKTSLNKKAFFNYTLVTEAMKINSRQQLYEKVMPIQKVKLRLSKVQKRLIGVTLANGEYVSN